MPFFEYECAKCEKVHEVLQLGSDADLTTCPDCGSPVKRIMSRSSFALKGSGWYSTDYKKSSPKIEPTKTEAPAPAAPATAEPKKPSSGCGSSSCGTGHKH